MAIIENFIGNWDLISMTSVAESGEVIYPLGIKVKGLLAYSEIGLMSAQLGSLDRKKFSNSDYRMGSGIEIIDSFNNFISYFGKFKINEERNYVIHEIEQSLFPNWIGSKVKRYFEFKENILTLRATPISYEGKLMTPTLKWQRI